MRVLLLDPGQLDHDDDEDHQTHDKNEEEVGDHAHIKGDVVTQPAATETHENRLNVGERRYASREASQT